MSEFCDVNVSLVSNVWIKQMCFRRAGWIARTHSHRFDHQTLLAVGSLRVTVNGTVTDHHAPAILVIQAGAVHLLESLVDGTVAYCIHALTEDSLVEGIENEDLHSLA